MEQPETQRTEGSGIPTFLARALVSLSAVLFLGFGLGMNLRQGASFVWVSGLLVTLALVILLMARWQIRPVSEPLSRLLGGRRPWSIDELPGAWTALEQENEDLRQKVALDERLLPGIMARLEEGVLLFARDGRLELFNPAAQRLLGLGAPLSKELPLDQVFHDEDSRACVRSGLGGQGREWRLARMGRTLRVRAIPFAPQGRVTGVLLTLDDVTRQEALETTRQKFISNVSHELKTPVTAIRIAAENLLEESDPGSVRQGAQSLLRSVDRLALLIQDLSELSRIESGALTLVPEVLRLDQVLADLVRELRQHPSARQATLREVLQAPPDTRIVVDPLRLHQVVENLVSNALKFSPPGGEVTLAVRVTTQGLVWEVTDQGPGIPVEEQGRIFERFYRAQAAKAKPGTGLGLAIVKHLSRLMGGEVTVESRPGAGATFRVILPILAEPQTSEAPPSL